MNSLTLKLSIFAVVLASICFSAPIVDQTTMESELFDTTELVPRALEEANLIIPFSATTEKDGEEMTTISTETSTKSSHDKESEGDESHETREAREFSEMNTSESPMYVTEKSTLYSAKDSHYDRMVSTGQPLLHAKIEEIPRESSTTMKMISTSFSSSTTPEKYLGRLEDQNERSEDMESGPKNVRKLASKPTKSQEEEQHHEQEQEQAEEEQPTEKVQKQTQSTVQGLAEEFPVTEESEVKGDYKVAEYDPKALDSIATVESNRLQYNENDQSIPNVPVELTTMQSLEENDHSKQSKSIPKEKTLDQAQKSPVAEEKKSDH